MGRHQTNALLFGVLALLYIFDMLVNRGVSTNTRASHLGNKVAFCKMLGRACHTLDQLELLWLESLPLLESWQLVLDLLFPGKHFKPVKLLNRDSLCMKLLSTHLHLDLSFCKNGVLANRRQKVSR